MTTKTDTEQERAEFEAWWDGLPHSMKSLLTYEVAKQAYELGRAALQSQDAERIINAARVAMDESFDHDDGYQDLISIPAEKAAALSLALDEYDASRRVEEKT